MAQYIDKSTLVAEIEKMLQEEYPCDNPEQTTGYHCALYELQGFLDTFEVKEINSTDTFIEKAVNWLQDNLVKETEVIASGCVSVRFNNVIEKFKQAMRGKP